MLITQGTFRSADSSRTECALVLVVLSTTKSPCFDQGCRRSPSRIPAVGAGLSVHLTRLVTVLMASGLALLALAVALSLMGASAAMVAPGQRLPVDQLNWCVGPSLEGNRTGHR